MTEVVVKPRGALLVGSIPLADAEAVFRVASERLGQHLRRIPDGETGERTIWIVWQGRFFAADRAFEPEPVEEGQYAPEGRHRLRDPGGDPPDFPDGIGYAAAAIESFATFGRLRREGVIREGVRFQVSLPTPLAPVAQFVSHRDQAAVEPAYERAMLHELEQICAAIPHQQLAVQWDVAIEMGIWEGLGGLFEVWFDDPKDGIVDRIGRLLDAVPEDVEAGLHLCYGDFGHEHFVQPADTRSLVAVANALVGRARRAINWVHMPVPRDRTDDAYFAPLDGLQLDGATELYLGVVHATDGRAGTEARIAAAQAHKAEFGVATECGFGRRPANAVPALLDLHAEVAEPVLPASSRSSVSDGS